MISQAKRMALEGFAVGGSLVGNRAGGIQVRGKADGVLALIGDRSAAVWQDGDFFPAFSPCAIFEIMQAISQFGIGIGLEDGSVDMLDFGHGLNDSVVRAAFGNGTSVAGDF